MRPEEQRSQSDTQLSRELRQIRLQIAASAFGIMVATLMAIQSEEEAIETAKSLMVEADTWAGVDQS